MDSSVGWPLAQPTSGGEGIHFVCSSFPQREKKRVERENSTFPFIFLQFDENQLQIEQHSPIPSVCAHYMCLSKAIIQVVCSVE